MLREQLADFINDESGQSITEYGAAIAFVGVLIASVFALAKGTLFGSVSQSFFLVNSSLSATNQAAAST